jgi:hypothetical protein
MPTDVSSTETRQCPRCLKQTSAFKATCECGYTISEAEHERVISAIAARKQQEALAQSNAGKEESSGVSGWLIFILIFGVGNLILYSTTGIFLIPIPRR